MPPDNAERFDFMNPDIPAGLTHFDVPLIAATEVVPENRTGR